MTRPGRLHHLAFLGGGVALGLIYLVPMRPTPSALEVVVGLTAVVGFWLALGGLVRLALVGLAMARLGRPVQAILGALMLVGAANVLLLEHLSHRVLGVFLNSAIVGLWLRHPGYSAFLVVRTLPEWFVPALVVGNLVALVAVSWTCWRMAVADDSQARRGEVRLAATVVAVALVALVGIRIGVDPARAERLVELGPELAGVLARTGTPGGAVPSSQHPDLFPAPLTRPDRPGPVPDMVIVVIDGASPRRLGCYGYARDTSPHIDRLARAGLRFDVAYAPASSTLDGITAILEGRYPFQGGEHHSHSFLRALDGRGYSIGVFSSQDDALMKLTDVMANPLVDRHWDSRDAVSIIPYEASWGEKSDDAETIDTALAWMRGVPRPFFSFIYLQSTHYPYHVPPGYGLFTPYRSTVDLLDFDAADAVALGNAYDGALRYADDQLGRLVDALEVLSPEAIVVVTADHGEALGGHDNATHGWSVFEEDVRVPLIIAGPDPLPEPPAGFIELVDLAPTLLGIAGIGYHEADFDGFDFFQAPPIARQTAFFHMYGGLRRVGGVRRDDLKLISYIDRNWDALYDLEADPGELDNVARARPHDMHSMWRLFNQWRLWRASR